MLVIVMSHSIYVGCEYYTSDWCEWESLVMQLTFKGTALPLQSINNYSKDF